jgi:hypothetical protein
MEKTREYINRKISMEFSEYNKLILINPSINNELKHAIQEDLIQNHFAFTIETLRMVNFDKKNIFLVIEHGIQSQIKGSEPFWGRDLISNRMKRNLLNPKTNRLNPDNYSFSPNK